MSVKRAIVGGVLSSAAIFGAWEFWQESVRLSEEMIAVQACQNPAQTGKVACQNVLVIDQGVGLTSLNGTEDLDKLGGAALGVIGGAGMIGSLVIGLKGKFD